MTDYLTRGSFVDETRMPKPIEGVSTSTGRVSLSEAMNPH